MNEQKQCTMCSFKTCQARKFIYHVVRNHKNDNNFSVQCSSCGSTYTKWNSYKKHIQRHHPNTPIPPLEDVELAVEQLAHDSAEEDDGRELGNEDEVIEDGGGPNAIGLLEANTPSRVLKWQAAKFLVSTRERGRISQRAMNSITQGTDELLQSKLRLLLKECRESADPETNTIPLNRIEELINDGKFKSMFGDISTEYLLNRYLENECGLMEPKRIVLGTINRWSKSNPPRVEEFEAYAYIAPFKKSLEQLLNNDQVLQCVTNPEVNHSDFIRNFSDGSYFKSIPVFWIGNSVVFLIFYYDDVVLTNPLSTKAHKVALFYWVLLNIHPHLRSTLKAINLYAIAKTSYLKQFGVEKIVNSFKADIKELESDNGCVLNIRGVNKRFHGMVLFVAGDTPASQYLGGFKEGVGGARMPCRNCMITKQELSSKFSESELVLRDKATHKDHVSLVCSEGLPKNVQQYWSKWYGVNEESVFSELQYFDVCQCFLQDFMHIIPEGVLPCELLHILSFCIQNELFDLKKFNDAIDRFNYGHFSRDTPAHVEPRHLENGLRQSAAQSLTLGFVFPFVLADLVEDFPIELQEMLDNLIRLLQIINICLCYEFLEEDAVLLSHIIKVHHTWFRLLYPNQLLTPKFHYMVHFPSQMLKFGPLRHSWCFRLEGFHAYFKSLIPVTRNFKNVEFTLLNRYLRCRWSDISGLPGEPTPNFLYTGDKVKSGKRLKLNDHPNREILIEVLPLPVNTYVMKSPHVCIHGTMYFKGSVILLECLDDNLPKFGKVVEVVVYRTTKILLYEVLQTEFFEKDVNAYKVAPSIDYGAINVKDLSFPHPLSCWSNTKGSYVVLMYHRRTEFMG